jgi:hypothetical protein
MVYSQGIFKHQHAETVIWRQLMKRTDEDTERIFFLAGQIKVKTAPGSYR